MKYDRKIIPKGWRRVRMGETLPENHKFYLDNKYIQNGHREDGSYDANNNFAGRILTKDIFDTILHIVPK